MAKIPRIFQRLFGSTALLVDVGEFGSLAAGTPTNSLDPVAIQSLSNWLDGWRAAVIGGNSPAIEDLNGFCIVVVRQLAYLFQAGVPEWDTTTVYFTGSLVNSGGVLYTSLTDNNSGNAVTDTGNWAVVGSRQRVVTGTDTATLTDRNLFCDPTSASFTQTLAPAAQTKGQRITIKNTSDPGATSNTVTPQGNAAELIDFVNVYQPLKPGESLTVLSDGVKYQIV